MAEVFKGAEAKAEEPGKYLEDMTVARQIEQQWAGFPCDYACYLGL